MSPSCCLPGAVRHCCAPGVFESTFAAEPSAGRGCCRRRQPPRARRRRGWRRAPRRGAAGRASRRRSPAGLRHDNGAAARRPRDEPAVFASRETRCSVLPSRSSTYSIDPQRRRCPGVPQTRTGRTPPILVEPDHATGTGPGHVEGTVRRGRWPQGRRVRSPEPCRRRLA